MVSSPLLSTRRRPCTVPGVRSAWLMILLYVQHINFISAVSFWGTIRLAVLGGLLLIFGLFHRGRHQDWSVAQTALYSLALCAAFGGLVWLIYSPPNAPSEYDAVFRMLESGTWYRNLDVRSLRYRMEPLASSAVLAFSSHRYSADVCVNDHRSQCPVVSNLTPLAVQLERVPHSRAAFNSASMFSAGVPGETLPPKGGSSRLRARLFPGTPTPRTLTSSGGTLPITATRWACHHRNLLSDCHMSGLGPSMCLSSSVAAVSLAMVSGASSRPAAWAVWRIWSGRRAPAITDVTPG